MSNSALPYENPYTPPKLAQRSSAFILMDNIARRLLDVVASLIGILLLLPFFAAIAWKIKHDSPGPLFYRGKRLGWRGQPFGILKFRTMWEHPASYAGAPITAQDDPRITPFGRWLRDTKVNELPQLWNVLTGDMSLVGPRPEDPQFAKQWPAEVKERLLAVRPGITSPASVLFRDEETRLHTTTAVDDYLRAIMPSKLRLDMLYINHRTLMTDLDVIFWTLIVLLPALKNHSIPEARVLYGPLSRFTSRYITWFFGDSLVAFTAIGIVGLIWRSTGPLDVGFLPSVGMAALMALVFSILNGAVGLNEVEWSRAPSADGLLLAATTAAGTAIWLLLNVRIAERFAFPPALLIFAGVFSMCGFIAIRYRDRLMTGFATRWLSIRDQASAVGERVLMVGAGQNSQVAAWLFAQSKLSRAFSIVGIVDDSPRKRGLSYDGYRVIGSTADIPTLVEKLDIGIIIFTITNIHPEDRARILRTCQDTKTLLVILPDVIGIFQRQFKIANTTYVNGEERVIDVALYDLHLTELQELAARGEIEQLRERIQALRKENRWNP